MISEHHLLYLPLLDKINVQSSSRPLSPYCQALSPNPLWPIPKVKLKFGLWFVFMSWFHMISKFWLINALVVCLSWWLREPGILYGLCPGESRVQAVGRKWNVAWLRLPVPVLLAQTRPFPSDHTFTFLYPPLPLAQGCLGWILDTPEEPGNGCILSPGLALTHSQLCHVNLWTISLQSKHFSVTE